MGTIANVLYYGILASFTGGWLPLRTKKPNKLLVISHLYAFLIFIAAPLTVFLVDAEHVWGWMIYTILIGLFFVFVKSINYRLHKLFGTDPIIAEDPKNEQSDKKKDATEQGKADEGEQNSSSLPEFPVEYVTKMGQAGVDVDVALHKSASSLNSTTDRGSMDTSGTMEMSRRSSGSRRASMRSSPRLDSRGITVTTTAGVVGVVIAETGQTDTTHKQESRVENEEDEAVGATAEQAVTLPSTLLPVDSSSHLVKNLSHASSDSSLLKMSHSHTSLTKVMEKDTEVSNTLHSSSSSSLQRSTSMPTQQQNSNNRSGNRSRICMRPRPQQQRNSSSSQQPPPSVPIPTGTESRAAEKTSDESYSTASSTQLELAAPPTSPMHQPTSPFARQLSDMHTLVKAVDEHSTDGSRFSVELVEKLPHQLWEAIRNDILPQQTYNRILERQKDLRLGHLPSVQPDFGNNDLYWWEESDGNWDFELVTGANTDDYIPSIARDPYQLQNDSIFDDSSSFYPASLPPLMSARRRDSSFQPRSAVQSTVEQPAPKLTFPIIPGWKKWLLEITFNRTILEEFVDRNISIMESLSGVVLAVLVCVVMALLLNIGFYKNFWVFALCFVVGTAHFSLLKNPSPDPASPTPGQNRTTAFSRGFYFILVGMVAFLIDVALENGPQDPLSVYRFNLASPQILLFVRDGLLIFILFFPVIFTVGLLPQVDTFIIYVGEQIDMNIFGGTAATGVIPAVYSVVHSVICSGVLYVIGYGAFVDYVQQMPGGQGCEVGAREADDIDESCPVHVVFAIYMGLLFALSYHMSRMSSDPEYVIEVVKKGVHELGVYIRVISTPSSTSSPLDEEDPLDALYKKTVLHRLLSDFLAIPIIFFVVFSISLSTVFCNTHDSDAGHFTIYGITCVLGVVNHYLVPHIRKEMPWLCFGAPLYNITMGHEDESTNVKVTRFEKCYQWSVFVERNLLYPLSFLIAFHHAAPYLHCKFGDHGAALVLSVIGLRLLRGAFTELSRQHIIFIFTLFFFNFDYEQYSESLPLDYFVISLLFYKFYDLLLKIRFIVIYISPWLFSWGSVAHLVLQPLLIPHAPFIFFMTLMASLFNAPVNPVVASTLFIISYARPVKFWEKNYKTNRLDNNQTRLQAQLDQSLRQPSHEHLDSLFYEHLTWALQKTLAGDLQLGRWGRVTTGDIFILSGDRLNALIHIIEYGNGFVTFQIRGLEFRGTYCHQREVEAITEAESEDGECCCCEPGHLPGLLSFNAAVRQRWLAWEVVSRNYNVPGYSISENQADYVFNAHEYRKNYIGFFVQAMIYMFVKSPNLAARLANEDIRQSLRELEQEGFAENSDMFSETLDTDYQAGSITRGSFLNTYYSFIEVCTSRILGRDQSIQRDQRSYLVTMCFACSLLGRRLFYQVMNTRSTHWNSVYCDYFLHGLYSMFVGDARPSHSSDEWVYQDLDILKEVVLPSIRIALKLHQDYFTYSEQYRTPSGIYSLIEDTHLNHVVAHEGDRAWRNAIILNRPSLLAMRYQRTNNDGSEVVHYPYTLVRLASRYIKFKVVKINRECVRSLWASQQHELIFLQNDDSERGSIQNAKPVLRNMVNSSMDLPIGYPVYVSPLTTSYIDEHEPINKTILGKYIEPLNFLKLARTVGQSCMKCTKTNLSSSTPLEKSTQSSEGNTSGGLTSSAIQRSSSIDSLTGTRHVNTGGGAAAGDNASIESDDDSVSEFMNQIMKPKWINKDIIIIDTSFVQDSINERWLKWPEAHWRRNGNRLAWKGWYPLDGMSGVVVHEWKPSHPKIEFRSHLGKIIVLVEIDGHFVPVLEDGIIELN